MDIARVGVALDPQPFVAGEKEVKASLDRLKQNVRGANAEVENSTKKAGSSFNQMAGAARTAASGVRSAFDGMANAVGIFSPKLGFALQALRGFAALAGSTASSLRSLGTNAASAGGGVRGLVTAMGSLAAVVGTVTVAIGALLAVVLPLVVAFKAVGAAFNIFSDGLQGAARFETLKVRFAGVLGSMEAAEQRMKDLAKLAAETPFELEGIAQASLTLENLTKGAFSSIEALKMVGDAAAQSGSSMDFIAEQVGKLYTAIKSGGDGIDDPARNLTLRGIFGPEIKTQLMEMSKAGKDFGEIWKVVLDQLQKTAGGMQNLSVTFDGRVSTMKDTWEEFKRTLGEAILPAATDVVKLVTENIGKLNEYAKSIAPSIKEMADNAVAFLNVLTQEGGFEAALRKAGDVLEEALNGGFMEFITTVNAWIKEKFGVDLKAAVDDLVNADVWKILETDIIPRIGTALGNAIWNAIAGALQRLGGAVSGIVNQTTGGALQRDAALGAAGNVVSTGQLPSWMPTTTDLDLPFSADDNVISTADEAAKFMGDNQLLPDINGVVADGGTVADNTAATEQLTQALEDTFPVYGPEQPMPAVVGVPAPGQEFDFMMQNALDQQQATRDADKASMKFPKRDTSASTFMPTKRAGRVGGGGKSEGEKMMDEGKRLTADLMTPMEEMDATIANLEKLKKAGAISAETYSRGVAKAKEEYAAAVDSMTEKAKKAAEDQMTALQRLAAQWTDVAKRVDELTVGVANSVASNMTTAITGMIDGTKSAKEAFADMAASIVNDILKMTTQMLVQYALGQAMGWFTGGAGGAAAAVGSAAVNHDGGVIGEAGPTRTVNLGAFQGAQRFHTGGVVGLQPGEVPVIAEKGETITTEDQERIKARLRGDKAKSAATQVAVTNVNVVDSRMVDEHMNKNPDAVLNVLSRNRARVKQILNIQG